MESLIGVAFLVLFLTILIVISFVSGSAQDDEEQSQKQDPFLADVVLFAPTEPEIVGSVVESVPWEAGVEVAGEGIGSILEVVVGLLIW